MLKEQLFTYYFQLQHSFDTYQKAEMQPHQWLGGALRCELVGGLVLEDTEVFCF